MRLDNVGRVEFLLQEIQKAERTEKELWDFIVRLAMVVLMMVRLEERLVSDEGVDAETSIVPTGHETRRRSFTEAGSVVAPSPRAKRGTRRLFRACKRLVQGPAKDLFGER